ncbi:MAG TPA: hypothetical protein VGJ05_20110, partial [Fimbriiglobus sp.]
APALEKIPPSPPQTSTAKNDAKDSWFGPGILYVAIGKYQGETVYSLESEPGRVVAYVVPATGFDIQLHVRKKVALMGKVLEAQYTSYVPLVRVSSAEPVK